MQQTTLEKSVTCSGIGLHSGRLVELHLNPAPADSGIVFCVQNGNGPRRFSPKAEDVHASGLCTTLHHDSVSVATVEHLLAAVRGLGIDNICITVSGGEVPIMDGSAATFVNLLRQAGTARQESPRRMLRLKKPLSIEQEGKWIKAAPHDGLRITCTIDFPHPCIGRQLFSLELTPESFYRHLAQARTFGFLKDVEMLRQNGLALGGSLDNAIVLDQQSVLNTEGLRFSDEFVRHKLLDFIGDMAVLELPLLGDFELFCTGHALNNAFARELSENRDTYLEETTLLPQQDSAQARPPLGPDASAAAWTSA